MVNKASIFSTVCVIALAFMLSASVSANASDKKEIMNIIADIEYGWENGDGTPFSKHFLDYEGAKYFESGGQNVGLQDLIQKLC